MRELLQNAATPARPRCASRCSSATVEGGAEATVICRDNGEGMTFEHARRYLFALYASSKEGKKNQAGKFGVGFWSILRFEPATIVIRSRPRVGAPWGVALDGRLERAVAVEPPGRAGHRDRARAGRRGRRRGWSTGSHDAVWQSARFCRPARRHRRARCEIAGERPAHPRRVRAARAERSFRRGQVRGVVGLGRRAAGRAVQPGPARALGRLPGGPAVGGGAAQRLDARAVPRAARRTGPAGAAREPRSGGDAVAVGRPRRPGAGRGWCDWHSASWSG